MTGERLAALAARWNRRWLAGAILAAWATGAVAGVAAARFGDRAPATAVLIGAAAALIALGAALWRRPRVDATLVARHLDRALAGLEESAELALADEAVTPLARLQRARARPPGPGADQAPPLPARAPRHPPPCSRRPRRSRCGPQRAIVERTARRRRPRHEPTRRITGVDVGIAPPAYTGRRPRRARDWDLDGIEAGARVTWRITVHGTVTAAVLVTTAGDSLPLRRDGPDRLVASLAPDGSRLYQVVGLGPGGRAATGYHRLVVVPDAAPVITVVRPDLRTTLPPGAHPGGPRGPGER
jgi:hypothetical protein